MLKAKLNADNEIETSGAVLIGDVYPDICCKGYDWEVLLVMPYMDDASVWGHCKNKDCPENNEEPFDPYHGISDVCLRDDLEVLIAEHED